MDMACSSGCEGKCNKMRRNEKENQNLPENVSSILVYLFYHFGLGLLVFEYDVSQCFLSNGKVRRCH